MLFKSVLWNLHQVDTNISKLPILTRSTLATICACAVHPRSKVGTNHVDVEEMGRLRKKVVIYVLSLPCVRTKQYVHYRVRVALSRVTYPGIKL